MKYTKLGNTDITVSRICVGGMSFGEVKEGGHLTHTGWESGSKRSDTDKVLHSKYDAGKENNLAIIGRGKRS